MLDRIEPWPPDYLEVYRQRLDRLKKLRENIEGAKFYYRTRPVEFIDHHAQTFDPRNVGTNTPAYLPFILCRRQRELVEFIYACLKARSSGLVEKSRSVGATWVGVFASVHLWLFEPGAVISWGSQVGPKVDNLGNPDSILEKVRIAIRNLPVELLPKGFNPRDHMSYMRIVNPETGATIIGEVGDSIGRGGRSLLHFGDEAAHLVHAEMIEASLLSNAACRIDMSSVYGLGTVFQRRRESGVDWKPGDVPTTDRTSVFVFDWRDHPMLTQDWYDALRAKLTSEGLLHVLASEVDRDYSASVQGVVIPAAWVRSAIDAHVKLNFKGGGQWIAGLDVADEGADVNALAKRRGAVLVSLDEWGERDTGRTARRAVAACSNTLPCFVQYDAIGMGSSIKAETNRLFEERTRQRIDAIFPKGLRFVPWNAGASPLDPDKRVIEGDRDSPINRDFYANLKAQGWWQLRHRFERTHRAVTEPEYTWQEDDLISLPSNLPLLWKLVKELSQPTITYTSTMKMLIDKMPEGTRSPNLADSVMMAFWPMRIGGPLHISQEVLRKAALRG
jgi:phage terminase large subunit